MKRLSILLFLFAFIFLSSCERDFKNHISEKQAIAGIRDSANLAKYALSSQKDSFFVDLNTAKLIAENINRNQLIQKKVVTTGNSSYNNQYFEKRLIKEEIPLLEDGIPYFYVFNYENGGFTIISSSKRIMPTLGYSENGLFDVDSIPLGLLLWLDAERSSVQMLRNDNVAPNQTIMDSWDFMACPPPPLSRIPSNSSTAFSCTPGGSPISTIKGPLLETKWNQGCGFNTYCPVVSDGPCGYAYTGCVATSVSQVMKYWNYPSSYIWANMSNDEWGSDETAKLMHDVGVAVNMHYGGISAGGSSAKHSKVPGALKNTFQYSSATQGGV